MYVYLKVTKHEFKINRQLFWQMAGVGVIIMVHWLAFYAAIKVSNVSVTMVAFSTGALFSAIIEPIMYKRNARLYEVFSGVVIIGGIALIFSIETQYWLGIVYGIIAAFLSSAFGVFNGLISPKLRSGMITFYELSAALISLTIYLAFAGNFTPEFFMLDKSSIIGLILLSLVCTVFPFVQSVDLAKHISPYTIVLTVNLETVYGIIWAILIFNENKELTPSFYVGVLIILVTIFLNSYLKRYSEKRIERRNEA
jgi:drug/metabolite transporter (DMT)-like permease